MKKLRTLLVAVATAFPAFQGFSQPVKPDLTLLSYESRKNSKQLGHTMPPSTKAGKAAAKPFLQDAVSEIVINPETGAEIYSRNADERRDPASLTKLMTAYIVMSAIRDGRLNLDQQITVSPAAAALDNNSLTLEYKNPDGSVTRTTSLPAGSKLTVREALVVMMTSSANGVASALAEATPIKRDAKGNWVSGTEREFAGEMNRVAQLGLGMKNSNFINASGLNNGTGDQISSLSTARDLAILARRVMKDFPEFENILAKESAAATVQLPDGRKVRVPGSTTNRFVEEFGEKDKRAAREGFHAEGVQKTGTNEHTGGINLLSTAANGNGVRLTSVVLGATSGSKRYDVAIRNLRAGFQKVDDEQRYDPAIRAAFVKPEVRDVSAVSVQRAEANLQMRTLLDADGKKYAVRSELITPKISQAEYGKIWHQPAVSAEKDENLAATLDALKVLGRDFGRKPPTSFNDRRLRNELTAFKYQLGLPAPEKGEYDTVTAKYLQESAKRATQFIARQQEQENAQPRDLVKMAKQVRGRDVPEDVRGGFERTVVTIKEQLTKAGFMKPVVERKWDKSQRKTVTNELPADGRVDNRLLEAIRDFQRSEGLKPDGRYDQITAQLLGKAASTRQASFDADVTATAPALPAQKVTPAVVAAAPAAVFQGVAAKVKIEGTPVSPLPTQPAAPKHQDPVILRRGNKKHDPEVEAAQQMLARISPKYRKLLGESGPDGLYGKDTETAFAVAARDMGLDRKPGEVSQAMLDKLRVAEAEAIDRYSPRRRDTQLATAKGDGPGANFNLLAPEPLIVDLGFALQPDGSERPTVNISQAPQSRGPVRRM